MIVCKLELWPGGNEREAQVLGVIEITNNLERSIMTRGNRGDYRYRIQKKTPGRVAAEGVLRNYPRRSYHPWNLVMGILNQVKNEKQGPV